MATVRASLALYDGVTGPLRAMNNAMNVVINSFEAMQELSSNAIDTDSIQYAREELARAAASFDSMEAEINSSNSAQNNFNRTLNQSSGYADTLMGKIKGIAAAYIGIEGAKQLFALSDDMTSTNARLNLIVDDEGSVAELEDKIMASAMRSRAYYLDVAEGVARLGANAADAFSGNDELIAFMELINKQFVISGTNSQEASAAMIQLSQGLASGALRGDEFNSIAEQAPGILNNVANYLGVTRGEIRELASEGAITADVVKNAMFAASDEINNQFNSMNYTWSQVWTVMKDYALMAINPVLIAINWLANNIETVGPIVLGLASIFGVLFFWTTAINAATAIGNTIKAISAARSALKAGATLAEAAATQTATGAQIGLNAAIFASPVFWIIAGVIALIAVLAAVINHINKVKGTSLSVMGVIAGGVSALCAIIINTVIGVINGIIQLLWNILVAPAVGVLEWLINVFLGGFDSIGDAFGNLLAQMISWLADFAKIATKIIDTVFGSNLTDSLNSWQSNLISKGKNEKAITLLPRDLAPQIDRITYSGAFDYGYSIGDNVSSKISDKFSNLFNTGDYGINYDDYDYGSIGSMDALEEVSDNTGNTAANTAKIADAVSISSEELKYLREIAEREAVNKFTTAEVKLDFSATATINNDMDIDGFINVFEEKLEEALLTTAEGVHE